MTKYMPILPIGMFHLFDECDISHAFILPQFWSIPEYRVFYASRSWDVVIIDNALYETPDAFDVSDLINIAGQLNSIRTYIVGPEKIGDGATTLSLMLAAIAAHGPRGDKWFLMSVFQGTPTDMYHMYDSLKGFDIGFAIPVSMYRDKWSRAGLKYFTGIRNHYVHALGIDDLTEIPDLVRAGIDSFDSSIVASAAVNGIDLLGRDLRILRTGSPNDPVRVNLTQDRFTIDTLDEAAGNLSDILSTIDSIKIEVKNGL